MLVHPFLFKSEHSDLRGRSCCTYSASRRANRNLFKFWLNDPAEEKQTNIILDQIARLRVIVQL
jgi:hypothetical protein